MTLPTSRPETFQDKVCRHFDVPRDHYGALVLSLTLYPHARWLPRLVPHDYLAPDRAFIAAVGQLTRWREFSGEALDFQQHESNRCFTRRVLRLRLSVSRLRVLFSEVWGNPIPSEPERLRGPSGAESGSFAID